MTVLAFNLPIEARLFGLIRASPAVIDIFVHLKPLFRGNH